MAQSQWTAMLWVRVITAILWRRLVREDLDVRHVIKVHTIAGRTANDRRADTKVADKCSHCDVHHIVSKAAAIWPAAGHNTSTEAGLNCACQRVAAKDAQAREAWIVRISSALRAIARQPTGAGGQIHLDQIGDKDSCDVSAVLLDRGQRAAEENHVDKMRQYGRY